MLFGSGIRAVCAGADCRLPARNSGELTVPGEEDRDRPSLPSWSGFASALPPQRMRGPVLQREITGPGRFDRGQVLARTRICWREGGPSSP